MRKLIKKYFFKLNKKKQFKESNYVIPDVLMVKYNKYLIIAALVFICGIFACCVLFSGFKILKASLFPITISIMLLLDGLYFKNKIVNKGYDECEGTCIDHKFSSIGSKLINADLTLKKYVIGVMIECNKEIISIPIAKGNEAPPIGSKVKVFVPKDAIKRITHNGISVFSNIYGYEIMSEQNSSDSSEVKNNEKK